VNSFVYTRLYGSLRWTIFVEDSLLFLPNCLSSSVADALNSLVS